jgi:hypothetical protein
MKHHLSTHQRVTLDRLEHGLSVDMQDDETRGDIVWLLNRDYIKSLSAPFSAVGFVTVTDKGRAALNEPENEEGN